MIKKIIALVTVLSIISIAGAAAYAEEVNSPLTNKLGVGAYGNFIFQRMGEFDTGFGGGMYAKYMLMDYLAVEGSYDVQAWGFEADIDNAAGTLEGTFLVMPLSFTAMLTYPVSEGKLYPYAGMGVDVVFISGDASGTLTPGGDSSVEYGNAFGVHVSSGFDWLIAENTVFNLDVKYTWAEPDASTSTSDAGTSLSVSQDLFDNFAIRLGLAYYF